MIGEGEEDGDDGVVELWELLGKEEEDDGDSEEGDVCGIGVGEVGREVFGVVMIGAVG